MTQRIANFFYDNSGSINATFTDTDGNTGSISESFTQVYNDMFYGFTDVEYESVKIYTGSCALQPVVTGSGFIICDGGNDYNVKNRFVYSLDGTKINRRVLSLPTSESKIGSGSYVYSAFSTGSTDLYKGMYGNGTTILWGQDFNWFYITDDFGKTWRYSPFAEGYSSYDGNLYRLPIGTNIGAYGNNVFVTVGSSGQKMYSEDKGYTWNISEGPSYPNFNWDKIAFSSGYSTQVIFDGTRFIHLAPHCEYDRDGEIYRLILGRYSYDGKKWHNFLPQNEFLVDYINSQGISKRMCSLDTLQLFMAGNSVYAYTETQTPTQSYGSDTTVQTARHIRRIYSSSIANDDTIVSFPSEYASSHITYGSYENSIGNGSDECVYIPAYELTKYITGGIEYYLWKFNPSTNSLTQFKYYTYYYDDNHPNSISTDIVGYNRDINMFVLCSGYNNDLNTPVFNIKNNTNVNISRMSILKGQYGYNPSTRVGIILPIESSSLSGSIPPTSSAEPPTNQYFASASLISSLYFTVSGSNENAATESIDPQMSASATVWFKWTPTDATGSSIYSITTLGSDFDTVLYLFELSGSESPENLVQLEWNDDYNGFTSNIDTIITGSKTYYICVGGHNGDQGNYILSSSYVNPPPANDSYENAFIMEGNSGVVTGSNRYATTEVIDGDTHYSGVWWKWSPSVTKTATINPSGSGFPLEVYVYTKTEDVFNFVTYTSEYSRKFSIQSGSTYYFVIGGQGSGKSYQGDIRLSYT